MQEECSAVDGADITDLLQVVAKFRTASNHLPATAEEAHRLLKSKGFSEEQIAKRVRDFVVQPGTDATVVLANYEWLHGISYLKQAAQQDCLSGLCNAQAIIALFRCAEICFHNMAALADKIVEHMQCQAVPLAALEMRWMVDFHHTLHKLGQLLITCDWGEQAGDVLDVDYSASYQAYQQKNDVLQQLLLQRYASELMTAIADKELDDMAYFVFFNEYVNCNYVSVWNVALQQVRLPGVFKRETETAHAFFNRMVATECVQHAVMDVELRRKTNLMQFRAYHQMSEIMAAVVNEYFCQVITQLVSVQTTHLVGAVQLLSLSNQLLVLVNDNIKPLIRTLTPRAYSAIRPALGVTSGSHSQDLRKGLFISLYPTLVRAFRLRIADFCSTLAGNDAAIYPLAITLLRNSSNSDEANLMRQLVYVYQHIRLWRDDHMQLIKNQLGVSDADTVPIASISGAENAAQHAQGFREVHAHDPIAPLYTAVLGKQIAPVQGLFHGVFDRQAAQLTSKSASHLYEEVQQRIQSRKQRPQVKE